MHGAPNLQQITYFFCHSALRGDHHFDTQILSPRVGVREFKANGTRKQAGNSHFFSNPAGNNIDFVSVRAGNQHVNLRSNFDACPLQRLRASAVSANEHDVQFVFYFCGAIWV